MESISPTITPYQTAFNDSIANREKFWAEQAARIPWFEQPKEILHQNERGHYRWFAGGKMNTSYVALDYHVENGRADQLALVYDSAVTDTRQTYTYRELRDEVAKFAGGLRSLGIEKGDRVVIYLPMIPQAAIAMLACARLGAVHSVVFGGFAPHELAIRIDDAKPKAIITASCGIEYTKVLPYKPLVEKAIAEANHKPNHLVLFQRPQHQVTLDQAHDIDWEELMAKSEAVDAVPVDAGDPLYILYTSGTTGKPKGIVRDNGGHAVALSFSMEYVYGLQPGETYWAASDVGWVVGHSYIVYAPLIHGCTTILFEGKPIRTPDASTFWRVMSENKVSVFFTAPTAFRAIRKEDSEGKLKEGYDLSSLRQIFLAGERCDVSTYEWLQELVGVPVIDHWWQTESGWPMLANMVGFGLQNMKPGSANMPVCGYDIRILKANGSQANANEEGRVVVKLPLPPGCLPTLWQDDERFDSSYLSMFDGYYFSGDGGYQDEDGYFFITGRIDDVMNVAGHRLSTAEMEEMVAAHAAVAECAVIGVADELRGQRPVGFVVLKGGIETEESVLEAELVQKVRAELGPVAYFKQVAIVERLPKTRSGKILRKIMRFIADGKTFDMPSTIDDPAILDEIRAVMQKRKIGMAFGG